jgi:hypothetical protein
MKSANQTFLRIRLLKEFLKRSSAAKTKLLEELVVQASDPIIRMRRFRMLHQLSQLESQTIKKIANLETDDPLDLLKDEIICNDIGNVVNRSG